jgi:hypothetical protein
MTAAGCAWKGVGDGKQCIDAGELHVVDHVGGGGDGGGPPCPSFDRQDACETSEGTCKWNSAAAMCSDFDDIGAVDSEQAALLKARCKMMSTRRACEDGRNLCTWTTDECTTRNSLEATEEPPVCAGLK